MAVESSLGDQIDQYASDAKVRDAVSQKDPFKTFGFLDLSPTCRPVIGRVEPEKAKGLVTYSGVLVICDQALGKDLFGLSSSIHVNFDAVCFSPEKISDAV